MVELIKVSEQYIQWLDINVPIVVDGVEVTALDANQYENFGLSYLNFPFEFAGASIRLMAMCFFARPTFLAVPVL